MSKNSQVCDYLRVIGNARFFVKCVKISGNSRPFLILAMRSDVYLVIIGQPKMHFFKKLLLKLSCLTFAFHKILQICVRFVQIPFPWSVK